MPLPLPLRPYAKPQVGTLQALGPSGWFSVQQCIDFAVTGDDMVSIYLVGRQVAAELS